MWAAHVRAQANLKNFISAFEASRPTHTPDYSGIVRGENYDVSAVWLNCSLASNTFSHQCRIVDPLPAPFDHSVTTSVNLETPYGLANKIISFIPIKIPLNGVSHTLNNTGTTLETKMWNDVNGITAVCTENVSPYAASSGAANHFLIHNSLSAGKSLNVTIYVCAEFSFIAVQADGTSYLKSVPVVTPQASFKLQSID